MSIIINRVDHKTELQLPRLRLWIGWVWVYGAFNWFDSLLKSPAIYCLIIFKFWLEYFGFRMRIHINISMNVRDISVWLKKLDLIFFLPNREISILFIHTLSLGQVRSVSNHLDSVDVAAAVGCYECIQLDDLLVG